MFNMLESLQDSSRSRQAHLENPHYSTITTWYNGYFPTIPLFVRNLELGVTLVLHEGGQPRDAGFMLDQLGIEVCVRGAVQGGTLDLAICVALVGIEESGKAAALVLGPPGTVSVWVVRNSYR